MRPEVDPVDALRLEEILRVLGAEGDVGVRADLVSDPGDTAEGSFFGMLGDRFVDMVLETAE